MKNLVTAFVLLAAASAAWAQSPSASTPPASPALEQLTDADVADALGALKSSFLQSKTLSTEKLNRATLQGLLQQLGPGAIFQPAPSGAKEEAPFRSETLAGGIGYVRLGSLSKANLEALDAALTAWGMASVKSLILDLRATPVNEDYDTTADLLGRFCPKGRELFSMKSAKDGSVRVFTGNRDPAFRGLLVVLVSAESGGPAEVIASVLRQQTRAMIIGATTSGRAVEYASVSFHNGASLLVAIAEAVLPEIGSLFPKGVTPDIETEMSAEIRHKVLAAELKDGVGPSIANVEVARMNEAALVNGGTPEFDALEQQQRNRDGTKPPLPDTVLQRALDVITSIGVLDRAGK